MESNSLRESGAFKLSERKTGILLVKCADEGIGSGSIHGDKIQN